MKMIIQGTRPMGGVRTMMRAHESLGSNVEYRREYRRVVRGGRGVRNYGARAWHFFVL